LKARAIGWAINLAAVLLETGRADNPEHAEMGARALERRAKKWQPVFRQPPRQI
jgi:hypothetical protein